MRVFSICPGWKTGTKNCIFFKSGSFGADQVEKAESLGAAKAKKWGAFEWHIAVMSLYGSTPTSGDYRTVVSNSFCGNSPCWTYCRFTIIHLGIIFTTIQQFDSSRNLGSRQTILWLYMIFKNAKHDAPQIVVSANKTATKNCEMSRLMTKPTKWHVRPAKTQISLGIRPVW